MNNEFLLNNASIEIQPKQNFHYRYASELAGNTHGTVSGQHEEYAKIKLLLPQNSHLDHFGNKRDFYVLCTLHCYDSKVLSPHLLMLKKETELNYDFIFEKMEENQSNPVERFWRLKEYVIVRLTGANYSTSFQNKRLQYEALTLPLQFENILGQLNVNDARRVKDSGKLNVCLGFTIFERDFYTNTYTLYRDTIFSCNIYHGDDLRIHRLCNTKGSVLGGTDVTILIRVEANLPLNAVIKKIDEISKETLWFTVVEIQKNNIFGNAAITFSMPPYRGPVSTDDEIEVFLCLRVGNSTYKSNDVRFYYINERTVRNKRNFPGECTAVTRGKIFKSENSKDYVSFDNMNISMPSESSFRTFRYEIKENDIKFKIDEVFKNLQFPENDMACSYTDSIFYEALESTDAFIHLYKAAKVARKSYLIAHFRNKNRENLLHWACKMNHGCQIRPLIGLACQINEQDNMGRTPLHLALAAKHTDCIMEIEKLIKDHSQYPKEVEQNFIKMFKVYNHNGYTVLHEAALGEYNKLLETMLIFFNKHGMSILDYEVLGSGDSIVHLVSKNKFKNIWPFISKYVPNYKTAANYAGVTTMSEDMACEANSNGIEAKEKDQEELSV